MFKYTSFLYFVLSAVIYTFWSFGIMKLSSVCSKIEYCLSRCWGALTVLHLSLLSMNGLNKTQTAIFTFLLHLLVPGDHITRIYLYLL